MNFKKHLTAFETNADYEAFKLSDEFITPNVSLCRDEHKLHYTAKAKEEYDPYNGHEYVDLGLPSGTLWATKVVGAESESDYGLYFAWGSTEGATKEQIESGEFLFGSDGNGKVGSLVPYISNVNGDIASTKYYEDDGKIVLDLEDDAAHVHMGGDWHMPTKAQCEELTANTTSTWTTQNGVNGMLFTSKTNGESVFIPSFGLVGGSGLRNVGSWCCVWSSSVELGNADGLNSESSGVGMVLYARFLGLCVLGVVG